MDKEAFEKMMANKAGLISFHTFLSIRKDRCISLIFVQHALKNLGIGKCTLSHHHRSCSIQHSFRLYGRRRVLWSERGRNAFSDEQYLSYWRNNTCEWQLASDPGATRSRNDMKNDLRELIAYIQEETFSDADGWFRLAQILWKMGKSTRAQHIYEVLLEQENDGNTDLPSP